MARGGGRRSRRTPRHPEALASGLVHVGRPVRPLGAVWSIALVNREPKRWAPRGHEKTREQAEERLRMLLAADVEGLYDGGWIRLGWVS